MPDVPTVDHGAGGVVLLTAIALRSRAAELVRVELCRLNGRLPEMDEGVRDEVARSLQCVVSTLLRPPTTRIAELSDAPAGVSYARALAALFDLDVSAPDRGH